MARKHDDLLADLEGLGAEDQPSQKAPAPAIPQPKKPASKPNARTEDENPFGEIEKQLAARPQPQQPSRPGTPRMSRPETPRLSSSATSAARAEHTPASSGPTSGRTSSEDRVGREIGTRKSGESARGYHQGFTPGEDAEFSKTKAETAASASAPAPAAAAQSGGGGGGWWGSMFNAASAAVKQAETLAKEISSNEEAQRWAGQVRSIGGKNLTNLQSLSADLRGRAIPTFTSLLQHIAPPISAHERLQIHTTHDILGYPSLDPLIYRVFERTMAQVEGGDLMVIQRGSEQKSRGRASSELQGYRGGVLGGGNGWSDGPWWREEGVQRSLGTVQGLKEGSRLARVSAEAYSREFFEALGGVEEAAKKATETLSETNPTRSSDIFLAIQAVGFQEEEALFAGDGRGEKTEEGTVAEPKEEKEECVVFAIYLHDPIHSLSFSVLSQPFPAKWASWLDASTSADASGLPESIQEIIASGGLDPREWVTEWMEEILTLGVGIVAQRYVSRRMGVGEGGLGRGKRRVEDDGMGGEAARAI